MIVRFARVFVSAVLLLLVASPLFATFCVPPGSPAQPPPPDPTLPVCEPCHQCSTSPCYAKSGTYVNDFIDLQIPTAGMYSLTVSRHYDSSRPADGPLGAGWSSSLTAHLYYATYLVSAPSTYSYEANIIMPDGVVYRFTTNGNAFTPPLGRYDTLVRNADGTYALTLQHTRSVYRFNADGSLASLTDDFGNVIVYTNDASGRIQRIADGAGSGRYIDVTWGADGRIASLTDNGGRVLKYFYETGNGTLSSFSDPVVASDSSSRSTYYTYVSGRFGMVLSRIADRWHRVITDLDWYPNGKLKSYTEGAYDGSATSPGEKYLYTYTPTGVTGSVTKTDSFTTASYNYDGSGLVNKPTTTYDALGNVATDSSGGNYRSFQYSQGNVTSMSEGGGAVTWLYTYDTNFPDKVASIVPTDGAGHPRGEWPGWVYQYNAPGTTAAGALVNVYRIRSDTTTRDQVAIYSYDAQGHLTSSGDDNRRVKIFAYNAAGDLASVSTFTSTYGYGYDSLGRQTSTTSPDNQPTTYTYDARDRITSVTLPKPTATSTLNFVTTYSYDNYDPASGLVFTNVTDANGRVTKSGYDALGHLAQAVDASGNVTTFTYQNNLLKKITDANGNITTYDYDVNRNLRSTSFPDGSTESYVIGNDGLVHSKTDRKGQQFTYSYDNFGRLGSVGFNSSGGWVGQAYTYAGQNLVGINDFGPTGQTSYGFTYDSSFRRTVQTVAGGEKTTYSYSDPFGWAGSLISGYTIEPGTGQSGTTQSVTYGYNPDGMTTSATWSWIPSAPFIFAYAPSGQYSRITFPNGQQRRFTYDNQGRLTNINNTSPGGDTIASFDYAYDYDWQTGTYSTLGQRTSVWVTAPTAANVTNGLTKYSYDSRYQLLRTDYPSNTYEAWTYDAIGNRLSRRTAYGSVFPYTYYQNPSGGNTQRLRNDNISTFDFTYDAAGNITGANGVTNYYTWDYANRLTSYAGKTYAYDISGRRSTTANGSTTRYIIMGGNTVGERNTTAGVATDYIFGPGVDQPLAKRTANGSITYFGVDGLGSVMVSTDPTGAVQSSTGYSPWGETATTPAELFGYTGRETGGPSWYYRARHYDAVRGRFLSEDPIGQSGGINHYAYVANDPILFVDPLGLLPSEPPGYHRPNPNTCCRSEIAKALDSTNRQLQRIRDGGWPSGTVSGFTVSGYVQGANGMRIPLPPSEDFDPHIAPNITDPCVRYCIAVHEYTHYSDQRPRSLDSLMSPVATEGPAYTKERICLESFH